LLLEAKDTIAWQRDFLLPYWGKITQGKEETSQPSKIGPRQGDQIGQCFAHWVIFTKCSLKSKNSKVTYIFGLLFSLIKAVQQC
jgi:hypothetical protein